MCPGGSWTPSIGAGTRRLARRQRIFVVADFGGRRSSAEILFKPRPVLPLPAPCGAGGDASPEGDRAPFIETGRRIPVVRPFQCFRMRGAAKRQEEASFRNSFGLPTDPFPTLLASDVTPFSFWYEDDPEGGCIRFVTGDRKRAAHGAAGGVDKVRGGRRGNPFFQPLQGAGGTLSPFPVPITSWPGYMRR